MTVMMMNWDEVSLASDKASWSYPFVTVGKEKVLTTESLLPWFRETPGLGCAMVTKCHSLPACPFPWDDVGKRQMNGTWNFLAVSKANRNLFCCNNSDLASDVSQPFDPMLRLSLSSEMKHTRMSRNRTQAILQRFGSSSKDLGDLSTPVVTNLLVRFAV